MTIRRVSLLCVGVAAAAWLPACSSDPAEGYAFRSTFPRQVRTVAVPIFDNQTFYHGLELDLTDALIKEIQRTTPMVVAQASDGRSVAQSTITGTIRDVQLRELTISDRTGLVQEQAVDVVVDFDWTDATTGRPIQSVRRLQALESFIPQRQTGERLETARQQVAQEMARRIVAQLRADW